MVVTSGQRRLKRLQQVDKTFAEMPPDRRGISQALEHFLATGELPPHEQYAKAVIQRTLSGWDEQDWEAFEPMLKAMAEARERGEIDFGPPTPPTPRERLLHETLDPTPAVRRAARDAIRELVAAGKDLRDGSLLSDFARHESPVGGQVLALLKSGSRTPRAPGTRR